MKLGFVNTSVALSVLLVGLGGLAAYAGTPENYIGVGGSFTVKDGTPAYGSITSKVKVADFGPNGGPTSLSVRPGFDIGTRTDFNFSATLDKDLSPNVGVYLGPGLNHQLDTGRVSPTINVGTVVNLAQTPTAINLDGKVIFGPQGTDFRGGVNLVFKF